MSHCLQCDDADEDVPGFHARNKCGINVVVVWCDEMCDIDVG